MHPGTYRTRNDYTYRLNILRISPYYALVFLARAVQQTYVVPCIYYSIHGREGRIRTDVTGSILRGRPGNPYYTTSRFRYLIA